MAKRDFLAKIIELAGQNPTRVARLIRDGWPEIQAAIEQGHTLKVIHQHLVEGGVRVSYRWFTMCIRQLRDAPETMHQQSQPTDMQATAAVAEKSENPTSSQPVYNPTKPSLSAGTGEARSDAGTSDPYSTVREHLTREPVGFHWDEEATDTSKLY
jgi:hypothetical protein